MKKDPMRFSVVLAVVLFSIGFLQAAGEVKIQVLNPRGEITSPPVSRPSARIPDLAGKKIGLYWNGKAGGDHFWNQVELLLKSKLPNTTILRYQGAFDLKDELAKKVAGETDAFLYGVSAPTNQLGGGAVATWTPQQILDNAVRMMLNGRSGMARWKRGSSNPGPMKYILFFEPTLAMELNSQGHTRASLQKYLYERATIPYEQLTQEAIASIPSRIESGEIPTDRISVFKEALKPGGRLPMLDRPEDIRIVVAGGIPGYSFAMNYWREGLYAPTSDQTKLIRGATLTKAGR